MINSDRKIMIYGASGHAKVVIDIVEKQGEARIEFLVDDNPALQGREFYGHRVIGGKNELQDHCFNINNMECLVAIGSNSTRSKLASWLNAQGFQLSAPAIHPSVQLGRGVHVGAGSVLMAGSIVNSETVIGRNVILNTGATVDHDCNIEDGVHVAPGAILCGGILVGSGSLIGAGAVILPNIKIGKNVVVGAGATVLENLPDGITVIGSPARKSKTYAN
jgi:sugar O-acyltransferase (sialic acid O-acetyltransferase NeuD family)